MGRSGESGKSGSKQMLGIAVGSTAIDFKDSGREDFRSFYDLQTARPFSVFGEF